MLQTDEIIEMARQADFCVSEDGKNISTNNSYGIIQYELEAFAKLVEARTAAKEREACAKVCESLPTVGELRQLERATMKDCAHAIRARGEPTSRGEE